MTDKIMESGCRITVAQMCGILVITRCVDSLAALLVRLGLPEVFVKCENNALTVAYFMEPTFRTAIPFYFTQIVFLILLPLTPFLLAHLIPKREWKQFVLMAGQGVFFGAALLGLYGTLTGVSVWIFPSTCPT